MLVGKTLAEIAKVIKPGVTTKELDKVAEEFIRDNGAVPTFKGFPNQYGEPFPASICTSVNEQVVHGIPSDDVVLKEGDVVSVDCGTYMNGFCGDSAYTFCVLVSYFLLFLFLFLYLYSYIYLSHLLCIISV